MSSLLKKPQTTGQSDGLCEALVSDTSSDFGDIRETLGELAANYLNGYLCDGSLLAIGGGRQMWCLVRSLKPRRLSVTITGLGIGQNDPQVLHAHSTYNRLRDRPPSTRRRLGGCMETANFSKDVIHVAVYNEPSARLS